ncbi:MAG: hypothetical protein ABJE47_05695 [bacterium]
MRRAVIALLALSFSACLTEPSEAGVAAGRYTLQSVNGTALPFTFPNNVAVVSEILILDPNGTFQDIATRSDGAAVTDVGNYTVVGNRVTFSDQTVLLLYSGDISGNVLTTLVGTFTERWQRQ